MAFISKFGPGADLSTVPSFPRQVASGTTSSIPVGAPVLKNGQYVTLVTNGTPVIGTDILAGTAVSNSTETASAAGSVSVASPLPDALVYFNAKNPSLIATQSQYNALVGSYVLFDVTAGVITVDTTATGSTHGLEIVDSDVSVNPGKVLVRYRLSGTELN